MADEDRFRVPLDADLITVLASETRRRVLKLLKKRRMNLSELARELDLQKSTVLEHLRRLTDAGLIERDEDEDRLWVYYELTSRGQSILNPDRARLYLAVGVSIVSAVAAVALLLAAQAFLAPATGPTSPDVAFDVGEEGSQAPFGSGSGDAVSRVVDATGSDVTWWRHLDPDLAVRLGETADGGTLTLASADDGRTVLTVAVAGQRARIDAGTLDDVEPGTYRLRYRADGSAGWTTLEANVTLASARVHVLPQSLVAGRSTTVRVVADPPRSLDRAVVRVDGEVPETVDRADDGLAVPVAPDAPGRLALTVGRLPAEALPVAPHLATRLTIADEQVDLAVEDARGAPIPDVAVHLDGRPEGFTNASGRLRFDLPADGVHRLNLTTEAGDRVTWPLRVRDEALDRPEPAGVQVVPTRYRPGSARIDVAVDSRLPFGHPVAVAVRSGSTLLDARRLDLAASGATTFAVTVPTLPADVTAQVQPLAHPPLEIGDGTGAPVRAPDGTVAGFARLADPVRVLDVRQSVAGRPVLAVDLANPSPAPATTRLDVVVDGVARDPIEVDVPARSNVTREVELSLEPGVESVVLAGEEVLVEIGPEAADQPRVPGPGPAALLAAAAAALLLRRRRR